MRSGRAARTGLALGVAVAAGIALGVAFLLRRSPEADQSRPADLSATPTAAPSSSESSDLRYVGRKACARCHPQEYARWKGSHHDLAMQAADASTVLGDFDHARFTHFGTTTEFFRRDGGFWVRTEGPDGEPGDFEVAHTFGVAPLQQYLIRLPGGRLQALSVAWDTRPPAQGGQRWFHLYPDEAIPPDDPLHWTGINQNWNHMCAECHSTGLRKRYRQEEDIYETSWEEIDVSCEACHGPGSAHLAWADALDAGSAREGAVPARGLALTLASDHEWVFDPGAPIARRVTALRSRVEVETCGRCHARRALLREADVRGRPLMDTHLPALLREGLYHADGQILEEVYVYGSFLQSRMYAAGVTCSDCHDPHSLAIEGDAGTTCAGCHRSEVFASTGHHHHARGSPGASCVACHMPVRHYMVIDARRDHSFRVPRPDLARELGVPDACTSCHTDRSSAWAASAARRWYGPEAGGGSHYGEALRAGRERLPGAEGALAALSGDAAQPAIVRATALELLGSLLGPDSIGVVRHALRDPDPLVRAAALDAVQSLEPRARLAMALPLLRDPVRAVRIGAVGALLSVPPELWNPADRSTLAEAMAEYRAAQEIHRDRPEGQLNLGALHAQLGELDAARAAYQRALRMAPWFLPAYVNLADVERQAGREDAAEAALRRALEVAPDDADVHHALGLALSRQKRRADAIEALARASELAPRSASYAYAHGLALDAAGQRQRALEALQRAHARFPEDRDILIAVVSLHRDGGSLPEALPYLRRLAELAPEDTRVRGLLAELEAGAGANAGRPGGP